MTDGHRPQPVRPTHEKQFGEIRIHLTDPPPRKGLTLLASVSKVLGSYLVDILVHGGIRREREIDGKVENVLIPISQLLVDPKERVNLAGTILTAIGDMNPLDALALAEDLLLGQAKVARDRGPEGVGWAWVTIADGDEGRAQIDDLFPSYYALIGAVRWAFQAYFLPTLAAPDTSESTPTGSGETQAAGSP